MWELSTIPTNNRDKLESSSNTHHHQHSSQIPSHNRRYTMPESSITNFSNNHNHRMHSTGGGPGGAPLEDLHAWSIYRQNLNSDFTDSALGSDERSPLPYGNFQLREQTVQSILRHPRLAPRSELGSNMYAYLKFGLPRVFPPNGGHLARKDNSSGYDSENDHHGVPTSHSRSGMHKKGHHHSRSKSVEGMVAHEVKVSRARSETDLIDGLIPNRFGNRQMRSATSETNLGGGSHHHISKAGSQVSLVSRGTHHNHHNHHGGPNSGIADGHHSRASGAGLSSRGAFKTSGHTNNAFMDDVMSARSEDHGVIVPYPYPHLQIRGLCYEVDGVRVLDGISLDLNGGEMMGVMATADAEGTSLLDVLTSRIKPSHRVAGEIWLNGNQIPLRRLGTRVAYVRRDYRLHPDITVLQTMQFHGMQLEMGRSEKRKKMLHLLDDLGLSPVRSSLVESLTTSERQRLTVACQLLQDPEIICLDQPTRGMDIFDTFFLVEYLKQWASSRARIAIMSIHPPTFEIFSMFTKVILVSTGRVMFYGHRSEMLPYFAFIEYPCPAFKNPSDYYIDLVTLDTLSNEALLESSQRIETLAESFRRKQEPLPDPASSPPQPLPRKISSPSAAMQFWRVWMYMIVLKFPWNIITWVTTLIFAATLSILIGAIYWNIRLSVTQDQNNLNDRLGFHWVILCIGLWPVLLAILQNDRKEMRYVARDISEGLYSRAMFIIAKTLLELPFICSILLAYIIPAYVMAGIQQNETVFYYYIGHVLLYTYTVLTLLRTLINCFISHTLSLTLAYLLFLPLALASYYPIHILDLGSWCRFLRYLSPVAWTFRNLLKSELGEPNIFSCPNNPLTHDATIVTQLQCQVDTSSKALKYFGFDVDNWVGWMGVVIVAGMLFGEIVVSLIMFILRGGIKRRGRRKKFGKNGEYTKEFEDDDDVGF